MICCRSLAALIFIAVIDGQCDPRVIGNNLGDCPLVSYDGGSGKIDLYLMPFELVTRDASYMTRAYAGNNHSPSIPGPVIHLRPNIKLHITLHNELGADQKLHSGYPINGLFEPNTTNLHTHGLHVGSEEPEDDVSIRIMPGESYEYEYTIRDHESGTFFYHPHPHGAVTNQIGGGAYGMLIVDDHPDNSPHEFIKNMPEVIVSIWNYTPLAHALICIESDDTLFSQTSGTTQSKIILVNGFVRPKITQNADQWYRWRMQHTSTNSILDTTLDGCEMLILALDGIWMTVPRSNTHLQFQEPSRIDVAIKCPAGGPYNLYDAAAPDDPILTVSIEATKDVGPTQLDLSKWSFRRQPYLEDTTGLRPDEIANTNDPFTILIEGTDSRMMNGKSFSGVGREDALHIVKPDTVEEWTLNVDQHPLHTHVQAFQLQADSPDGFYKKGDWLDTYYGHGLIKIRARIGNFNGYILMHCHVSAHSDQGLVGIMWIDGVSNKHKAGQVGPADRKANPSSFSIPTVPAVMVLILLASFIYLHF